MITTASPSACRSPAAMAISLPKLRLKEMAANRGSAAFSVADAGQRPIGRAVVDEQHRPGEVAPVEAIVEFRHQRVEPRRLVEDGDDKGDLGALRNHGG